MDTRAQRTPTPEGSPEHHPPLLRELRHFVRYLATGHDVRTPHAGAGHAGLSF